MAHINPIKSRPLSPRGRENYDRIFRKHEITGSHPAEDGPRQAWEDKRRDQARELHHELAQKHIDQSA